MMADFYTVRRIPTSPYEATPWLSKPLPDSKSVVDDLFDIAYAEETDKGDRFAVIEVRKAERGLFRQPNWIEGSILTTFGEDPDDEI